MMKVIDVWHTVFSSFQKLSYASKFIILLRSFVVDFSSKAINLHGKLNPFCNRVEAKISWEIPWALIVE